MTQLAEIETQILDQIDITRADHHACTAGHIAAQLGVSKSWIVARCEHLKELGLVDWTPMAGSLHRTNVQPNVQSVEPVTSGDDKWGPIIVESDVQPQTGFEFTDEYWTNQLGTKPVDPVGLKIWNGRKGAMMAKIRREMS